MWRSGGIKTGLADINEDRNDNDEDRNGLVPLQRKLGQTVI